MLRKSRKVDVEEADIIQIDLFLKFIILKFVRI